MIDTRLQPDCKEADLAIEESTLPQLIVENQSTTRIACIGAFCLGSAISIACVASAIALLCKNQLYRGHISWIEPASITSTARGFQSEYRRPRTIYPVNVSGTAMEVLALTVNVVITACVDGLAYIHSVSLRWALLQEKSLRFNTNIRLLRNSNVSRPNAWYSNTFASICLILCYAGTSLLFITEMIGIFPGERYAVDRTVINIPSLFIIAFGVFGQLVIASWCYVTNMKTIPTWTAHPLNTTLVASRLNLVQRNAGRCMISAGNTGFEYQPMKPTTRQRSATHVVPNMKKVVVFIWALAALAAAWTAIVVGASYKTYTENYSESTWKFTMLWSNVSPAGPPVYGTFNSVVLDMGPNYGTDIPFDVQPFLAILFAFAVQGLQAAGLHCAELVINVSRDEGLWRKAGSDRSRRKFATSGSAAGASLTASWTWESILNWKYVTLFVMKSVLHWALGQSLVPAVLTDAGTRRYNFQMNYCRLLVFTMCAVVFAIFVHYLAYSSPLGPQPATYGHLQTISDLVDSWETDEKGRFWWGDKGLTEREGVRHAGMSNNRDSLGSIVMDSEYAG